MRIHSEADEGFPTNMADEVSRGETFVATTFPLSIRQQNRNLLRFAFHFSLIYLAAPVVYVGNLDAVLLNKLGHSDMVANLPASAYTWTLAPFLVLFTWYFCHARMLKPILVASYAVMAGAGLIALAGLLQPESDWLVAALVGHAILTGWSGGVANLCEWEILARGVPEQRRGLALSLAFGVGPLMAVLSSLGAQLVLDGRLGPIMVDRLSFPHDYLALFGASVVIMAIPAFSATRYLVPLPALEVVREKLISGVFGGLRDFLRNHLLMLVSVSFLLVMVGNSMILPNVVLYTKEAIGEEPQAYAGYQFALRFGFKTVAGLLLGWLLVRTHPRAGLTATTLLSLLGLVWALCVPGKWYLVTFGILGAGELYGVYYPNYLVSCSPGSQVRRHLAYAQLLTLPATVAPLIFGTISDKYGFRSSIETAALLLLGTILLILLVLPRRPGATLFKSVGSNAFEKLASQPEVGGAPGSPTII
jgi:hypothetical protein